MLLDQPEGATATLDENGQLVILPNEHVNGLIVAPYRVCVDDNCTDAIVNLSVQAVNDEPVPVPDTVLLEVDETVLIDVVANDVDVDDELLTLASISEVQGGTARIVDNKVEFVAGPEPTSGGGFEYTIVDGGGVAVSRVLQSPSLHRTTRQHSHVIR